MQLIHESNEWKENKQGDKEAEVCKRESKINGVERRLAFRIATSMWCYATGS